jgi:acyl-coenzyme A synthetase/AMP-(fatty) acid ligase
VHALDALPRNANDKIDRLALARLAQGPSAAS